MTARYNVLEQLRRGEPLGPKDRQVHEQGLVSVLCQLHDDLDVAVLAAYGWEDLIPLLTQPAPAPADAANPQGAAAGAGAGEDLILERLVALNAERAAEERRGRVRWLRPEFQNPHGTADTAAVHPETASAPAASPTGATSPADPPVDAARATPVPRPQRRAARLIHPTTEQVRRCAGP